MPDSIPLDAGAQPGAGEPSDMPPLNAGDIGWTPPKEEVEPEVEPKAEPEVEPKAEPEVEPEAEPEVEPEKKTEDGETSVDLDILDTLMEETGETQVPLDKTPDNWDEYQAWKQAREKAAKTSTDETPPDEPPAPVPVEPLEFTQEEFDECFSDPKGLGLIAGKIQANLQQEAHTFKQANEEFRDNVAKTMNEMTGKIFEGVERMLWFSDAKREDPDIQNYPSRSIEVAVQKAMSMGLPVHEQVPWAIKAVKQAMVQANQIRKSKNVDVRGNKTPPKVNSAGNRGLHSGQKEKKGDNTFDFLSKVYGG